MFFLDSFTISRFCKSRFGNAGKCGASFFFCPGTDLDGLSLQHTEEILSWCPLLSTDKCTVTGVSQSCVYPVWDISELLEGRQS